MDVLIALLIFVIIAAVLFWLVGYLPIEARAKQIIYIILAALLILGLLIRFGSYLGLSGVHR